MFSALEVKEIKNFDIFLSRMIKENTSVPWPQTTPFLIMTGEYSNTEFSFTHIVFLKCDERENTSCI